MSQEIALSIVNNLHAQLATIARSIVTMLADRKVSPWEGMQVGMQGMSLASYVMTVLQGIDDATKADLLTILEHGKWILPQSFIPANLQTDISADTSQSYLLNR